MMERSNENAIEWLDGQETATVTYSSRYAQKILKLAEKYPEEVKVLAVNTDKSICAHVPMKWVTVRPPRKVVLTGEQREQKAANMMRLRAKQVENRAKRAEAIDLPSEN